MLQDSDRFCAAGKLRTHNITLEGGTPRGSQIRLRSMTENDWDILLKWNSDPEVLYYADAGNVTAYTLDDVQDIYRKTSQNAFCFVIEVDNNPVGECWLQKMNLERYLQEYSHLDCRRIDIMIGEKRYWGRGIGTEVTCILTEFGLLNENADMIFCCNIANYNIRALKAVQKAGYKALPTEGDFALTRNEFLNSR